MINWRPREAVELGIISKNANSGNPNSCLQKRFMMHWNPFWIPRRSRGELNEYYVVCISLDNVRIRIPLSKFFEICRNPPQFSRPLFGNRGNPYKRYFFVVIINRVSESRTYLSNAINSLSIFAGLGG